MLRIAPSNDPLADPLRRLEERVVCGLLPADIAGAAFVAECLARTQLSAGQRAASLRRALLECEAERHLEVEAEAGE